eukprot:13618470-Ditylum_brightwellii.AAC.1
MHLNKCQRRQSQICFGPFTKAIKSSTCTLMYANRLLMLPGDVWEHRACSCSSWRSEGSPTVASSGGNGEIIARDSR